MFAGTWACLLLRRFIWLADAGGATVYKIDSTKSGAAAVVGAYASRPSAMAGNPVPFAVLSNGDAYVSQCPTHRIPLEHWLLAASRHCMTTWNAARSL